MKSTSKFFVSLATLAASCNFAFHSQCLASDVQVIRLERSAEVESESLKLIDKAPRTTSPDGTVTAGFLPGWTPTIFQEGAFIATGPKGERASKGLCFKFTDPRSKLKVMGGNIYSFTSDAAKAFEFAMQVRNKKIPFKVQGVTVSKSAILPVPTSFPGGVSAANLWGTMQTDSGLENFEALIVVSKIDSQGAMWTAEINMLEAPSAFYDQSLVPLFAMLNGYQLNSAARQAQVEQANAAGWAQTRRNQAYLKSVTDRNTAVFNASMHNAHNVQSAIDRSTAATIHTINGTTVLQDSTGQHFTAPQGTIAPGMTEVPMGRYVKGVDYN